MQKLEKYLKNAWNKHANNLEKYVLKKKLVHPYTLVYF